MLDPNGSTKVPERLNRPTPLFLFVTTQHAKKFVVLFLPAFILFPPLLPTRGVLPALGAWLLVSAVLAALRIQGVPLEVFLRNRRAYLRRPTQYTSKASTPAEKGRTAPSRELLRVRPRIEQGILVTEDQLGLARYAITLRVTPPNFAMMRRQEQISALSLFGEILRGTGRPLQVLSCTQPFDPESYFRNFKPHLRERGPLADYTLHYLSWLEAFSRDNQMLDRDFYVVLSETGPLPPRTGPEPAVTAAKRRKAMASLQTSASQVRLKFLALGAACQALSSKQAAVLLQDLVNPKAFTRENKLRKALLEPHEEADPAHLKVPDVRIEKDRLLVGQDHVRTLVIKTYPERVPVAWLDSVLNMNERIVASIHYQPLEPDHVMRILKRERVDLILQRNNRLKQGLDAIEVDRLLQEKEQHMLNVSARTTLYYEVTVYVSIHATTRKRLEAVTEEIKQSLRSNSIRTFAETYTQREAFEACLPLGVNPLRRHSQTMDIECCVATYPFLTTTIRHPEGVLLGFHFQTGAPYLVDRWSFINYNSITAGASGSGKSYSVKLELARTAMLRPDCWIYIIDPLREFGDITRTLGGEVVYVGHPSTVINPFDIERLPADREGTPEILKENPFIRKLLFLGTFFDILLEQPGPDAMGIVKSAVLEAYARRGITKEVATHGREVPVLQDILDLLGGWARDETDRGRQGIAQSLLRRLLPLLKGPLEQLNGRTNLHATGRRVCFDLKSLDKSFYTLFMFVVMNHIESRLLQDHTTKKIVAIDEAWYLLGRPSTAKELHDLVRHTRHYAAGLILLSQSPKDFLVNEYAEAVFANCMQSTLFRLRDVPPIVRDRYGLDDSEAEMLTRLGQAQDMDHSEALFIAGSDKAIVKIYSAPEEHVLVTTKPEDIAKRHGPPSGHVGAAPTHATREASP